jgi:hypothetical protein
LLLRNLWHLVAQVRQLFSHICGMIYVALTLKLSLNRVSSQNGVTRCRFHPNFSCTPCFHGFLVEEFSLGLDAFHRRLSCSWGGDSISASVVTGCQFCYTICLARQNNFRWFFLFSGSYLSLFTVDFWPCTQRKTGRDKHIHPLSMLFLICIPFEPSFKHLPPLLYSLGRLQILLYLRQILATCSEKQYFLLFLLFRKEATLIGYSMDLKILLRA